MKRYFVEVEYSVRIPIAIVAENNVDALKQAGEEAEDIMDEVFDSAWILSRDVQGSWIEDSEEI